MPVGNLQKMAEKVRRKWGGDGHGISKAMNQ